MIEDLTEREMLRRISSLPAPDLLGESKLSDPVGSDAFYNARTVVGLLRAQRERIAAAVRGATDYCGGHGEPPMPGVSELVEVILRARP